MEYIGRNGNIREMEISGIGDSVVHEETMEYGGDILEIAKERLLFIW